MIRSSHPKQIDLLYPSFLPHRGGVDNYLFHVAKALVAQDIRAVLFTQADISLSAADAPQGVVIHSHPCLTPHGPLRVIEPLLLLRRLKNVLHRANRTAPDALWSRHCLYALASLDAYPDRPHVYIAASVYPTYLRRFAEGMPLWKRAVLDFHARQYHQIEREAVQRANAVVTLSQARKVELAEVYGIAGDKIHVVPPGISLERFHPPQAGEREKYRQTLDLPRGAKIVLCVARLAAEKNPRLLLDAFALVTSPMSYLVFCGDGPERPFLETEARRLGLSDRLRFLGVSRTPEDHYRAADLFVLPSTYEGFGHVYLEAMASGLPCIGITGDGKDVLTATQEIVNDGLTGLLVPKPRAEMLAEKIERLLGDDDLRQAMGQNALQTCRQKFTWNAHVNQLLELQ